MREWFEQRERELKAEQQRAQEVYHRLAGALVLLAEAREAYEKEQANGSVQEPHE